MPEPTLQPKVKSLEPDYSLLPENVMKEAEAALTALGATYRVTDSRQFISAPISTSHAPDYYFLQTITWEIAADPQTLTGTHCSSVNLRLRQRRDPNVQHIEDGKEFVGRFAEGGFRMRWSPPDLDENYLFDVQSMKEIQKGLIQTLERVAKLELGKMDGGLQMTINLDDEVLPSADQEL